MKEILDNIIKSIGSESVVSDCDYIGSDGLMYCGKCNTRKQKEVPWLDGSMKKVFVTCECRRKELDAINERMRQEEEIRSMRALRIESLMDKNFENASFDKYETTKYNEKSHKIAVRYAENFKEMYEKNQGLLMYGSFGTGKSFTAACIANYLLEQRMPVVMTSFVKILAQMHGMSEDVEKQYAQMLNNAKLLIIDDLGAERNTDYALEKVYGIIDGRYRTKKPLILTTNLNLQDMKQNNDVRYARIYDRIFEMCYPVKYDGPSWRTSEAARRYEDVSKILEV